MIHVVGFAIAFLACFFYAFVAGGRPERVAMLAQLGAFLFGISVIAFHWTNWRGFPVGVAMADVGLAVALTALALKANRLWPMVLAGLQLATVFAHAAKVLSVPLPTAGYAIFVQLWGWPMLLVTAIGIYKHRERTKRHGSEQDWKPLWPRSVQAKFTA